MPAGTAVGLAGLLTLSLTGWNAWEFRKQNKFLADQNKTQKEQLDIQKTDMNRVRRAQLLVTIYEEDCKSDQDSTKQLTACYLDLETAPSCWPRAHERPRKEAVQVFAEIERNRKEIPDLAGSNLAFLNLGKANLSTVDFENAELSGARLSEANFRGANLSQANLCEANLYKADLSGADLREADLREAVLRGANFSNVDLSGADLREADLRETNLTSADLSGAKLAGAILKRADFSGAILGLDDGTPEIREALRADLSSTNLSGIRNLTQVQINSAMGDSDTDLPPGLFRPDHWPQ